MAYYAFGPGDIINTQIVTNPLFSVALNGNQVTGSIYYERPYLDSDLANRELIGFSERLGGETFKFAILTASVDFVTAVSGGDSQQLYGAVQNLCTFYSLQNNNYNLLYSGSLATTIRVVTIPEVYYDRQILSGTFTGSDIDASGTMRYLYDDCQGGIYSGSLSSSLVGNIFYAEGLVVLKSPNLQDFAQASQENFIWRTDFKGTHTIPCNIYQCRAPGGQLNASTNPSFYTVPVSGVYKNTRQILTSSVYPYITAVGLYNEDFELVAVARLAQPVKKEFGYDITFKCKMDW